MLGMYLLYNVDMPGRVPVLIISLLELLKIKVIIKILYSGHHLPSVIARRPDLSLSL